MSDEKKPSITLAGEPATKTIDQALQEGAERKREVGATLLAEAKARLQPAVEAATRYVESASPLSGEYGPKLAATRESLTKIPASYRGSTGISQWYNTADAGINGAQVVLDVALQLQADLQAVNALDATGKRPVDFWNEVRKLEANLNRGKVDPVKAMTDAWATVEYALENLAPLVAEVARQRSGV